MRLALAALLLLAVSEASAHSWYDPSCCSDRDCQPVADGVVEERADGIHVQGFPTVLRYDDYRLKWSKDDQDHVCSIGKALLCVYRKPKGY